MLTIEKRGFDKRAYVYGISAMLLCSVGTISIMAIGGSMSPKVASVTTGKGQDKKSDSKPVANQVTAPDEEVDVSGSSVARTNVDRPVVTSEVASQSATTEPTSPQPAPSTTPTPSVTPTPSPDPTPTPPVEPPVEQPTE